ncbi:MAG: hypothetical protein ACJAUV_001701, partial [Flavobacteriales bacterium]
KIYVGFGNYGEITGVSQRVGRLAGTDIVATSWSGEIILQELKFITALYKHLCENK